MDTDSNHVLVATINARSIPTKVLGSLALIVVLSTTCLGFVQNVGGFASTIDVLLGGVTTMPITIPLNRNEKPQKFNELNFKRWWQKILFYPNLIVKKVPPR